jgi:hypothetical protein
MRGCDWTGVSLTPLLGYGRTGGNPVLIAGDFSLALIQSQHRLKNDWNLFASRTAGHGAPLTWLPLITAAMGTYLMNEYSIFKEHPCRVVKRKTGKGT